MAVAAAAPLRAQRVLDAGLSDRAGDRADRPGPAVHQHSADALCVRRAGAVRAGCPRERPRHRPLPGPRHCRPGLGAADPGDIAADPAGRIRGVRRPGAPRPRVDRPGCAPAPAQRSGGGEYRRPARCADADGRAALRPGPGPGHAARDGQRLRAGTDAERGNLRGRRAGDDRRRSRLHPELHRPPLPPSRHPVPRGRSGLDDGNQRPVRHRPGPAARSRGRGRQAAPRQPSPSAVGDHRRLGRPGPPAQASGGDRGALAADGLDGRHEHPSGSRRCAGAALDLGLRRVRSLSARHLVASGGESLVTCLASPAPAGRLRTRAGPGRGDPARVVSGA